MGFKYFTRLLFHTFLSISALLVLGVTPFFVGGCASTNLAESNSPEAAFKAAEEFEKDERFEEALTKFNEVKNKHPYSRFAVDAELHIADIHYKREAFIESQTAYQLFKDFHPKYPRIDYVTFRLAMSYFMQLPPSTDRDLTPAHNAIKYFSEVITSYPTSEFVKEATQKKAECYRMLADKEMYVAYFYRHREMYDSALKRYESLLSLYPNNGFDEEATYYAGICAFESSNNELGRKYLNEVISKFPTGSWVSRAKNALDKYGNR
jgi:outer membrane protein assembly factor BamD